MKISKTLIFLVGIMIIFPLTRNSMAQEAEELSLDKGTLNSQFEYVIKKSSPYLEFRVVEETWLKKLNSHVSDSIKKIKLDLSQSNKMISSKEEEIDSINSVLQNTRTQLSKISKEKNSLSFFGILMSKAAYNSLVWSIIAGLIAGLVFFIVLFKRSHIITTNTRKDLEATQKEFEEHRTRARLREEKIVREYHYELNKYKNI
ncbi:MAG: tRNA (guanine-N1)-methyltransferase [Bacteroidota bacterium]|nr:tRNA (guanine-N1)-methyltransferase [Bacteroidota bacterium]